MRYVYKGRLVCLNEDSTQLPEGLSVEIVSREEFEKRFAVGRSRGLLLNSVRNMRYCKADVTKDAVIGSLICPDKRDLLKEARGFGYYMDRTQVVFIDDGDTVEKILNSMMEKQGMDEQDTSHFFFEFLEFLIKDDSVFLQEYEKKLAELEDLIYRANMKNVPQHMMMCRRELLSLTAYYHQLMDLSDILEENINGLFTEQETRLFTLFSNRVGRLYDSAQVLREYAMQLRELQQAQIDVRQNQVMQFLTVVTTVFMPLTLIAGWYGMNFVNMPELKWENSYFVVIGLSVLIIVIELWYFKRKKWF